MSNSQASPLRHFDFVPSIDVLLRTFAVLVAIALSQLMLGTREGQHLLGGRKILGAAVACLMALELRIFLGAANHLKETYVTSVRPDTIGRLMFRFFKDVVFLVGFGVIAIHIGSSLTMRDFTIRASRMLFLATVWCVLEPITARILRQHKTLRRFYARWLLLDASQLLVTLAFVHLVFPRGLQASPSEFWSIVLAVVYTVIFALDVWLTMDLLAEPREPDPALPAAPAQAASS